ncbi:MAG: cytochrome c, partial [Opitutales bacterium]
MKQFLFSFFALLLLLGVGGFLLIYSGLYSVAATAEHTAFERWVLETAKRQSVAQAARDVDVPDLEDHAAILRGAGSYQAMCLTCHGAPGVERSAMGRGLNPLAPEPEEMLRLWSPEEMFWITKNGIRMTGMPAWGATHTEEELWELVAFIQEVEGMTPEEYEAIVADAPEHEH